MVHANHAMYLDKKKNVPKIILKKKTLARNCRENFRKG